MLEQNLSKYKRKNKICKKSGFCIIETVVSILILSLFISSAVTIQLNCYKVKKYNSMLDQYIIFIEGLRVNLLKNYTYAEIISTCQNNVLYINNENINLISLKQNQMLNLITNNYDNMYPYVKLELDPFEGSNAVKITINLVYKYDNKVQLIQTSFIKGNYS